MPANKPKETTRFIAYDAFLPEIKAISDWLIAIERRLEEIAANEPVPYILKRAQEGSHGFNISQVVESALLKMARELTERPLGLYKWEEYYTRYVEAAKEIPEDDSRSHAGERKIWISEHSKDQINTIIQHAETVGVEFPLYHRKDSPRFRLIVALAIMYTADHLPPLPV